MCVNPMCVVSGLVETITDVLRMHFMYCMFLHQSILYQIDFICTSVNTMHACGPVEGYWRAGATTGGAQEREDIGGHATTEDHQGGGGGGWQGAHKVWDQDQGRCQTRIQEDSMQVDHDTSEP